MKLSAVIAVTEAIATEIQDEAVLETLSSGLRDVIRGNLGNGHRRVNINQQQNVIMDLRGTNEELQEAFERWPNGITILGVWNRDGTQVGTEYFIDNNGQRQKRGSPKWPINIAALNESMPDKVAYGRNGEEISRTPQTEYHPVVVKFGEKPREMD